MNIHREDFLFAFCILALLAVFTIQTCNHADKYFIHPKQDTK